MLIDTFIFYNEIDLLNYRLNLLYNVVDYFVIVEATLTHSGKPKKLFFEENKELFSKFTDKIVHVVVTNLIEDIDTTTNTEAFKNEHLHRNSIDIGIKMIENMLANKVPQQKLGDADLIIISDADEIPDPITLQSIKKSQRKNIFFSLQQKLYYYNLKHIVKVWWGSSKILGYNVYTKSCGRLPQIIRNFPSIQIPRGGWHLSYFGDGEFIRTKLKSFAEQNFNDQSILDDGHVEECIEKGKDILKRTDGTFVIEKCSIQDNDYLPLMFETYLTKYM